MKTINANQSVKIPKGIEATVKSRIVTIKGPRGVLKRNFKHLALDIHMSSPKNLKVEKWFGTKKQLAAVRTVCSHIENMIKGEFSFFCIFPISLKNSKMNHCFSYSFLRCHQGLPVQDACRICPFPHQLRHLREQHRHRDP